MRSSMVAVAGVLSTLMASSPAIAEKAVPPQGEFAKIDTRLANETMQILANGTGEQKQSIIEKIKANPENYAPPVFYLLSNVLFAGGEKDEGAFWFYTGQLRARVDANLCSDSSARQTVSVLNGTFGTAINQYTFQDIPKLEALIPKSSGKEKRRTTMTDAGLPFTV